MWFMSVTVPSLLSKGAHPSWWMITRAVLILSSLIYTGSISADDSGKWIDITDRSGLENFPSSRVKFADLNHDSWPDIVLLPETNHRELPTVYINQGARAYNQEVRFQIIHDTGLPKVSRADVLVFADIDNDGSVDAIVGRYLDIYQDDYEPPQSAPMRSAG